LAIPDGAFRTKAELLKAGEKRVVLSSIEAREPILKWKITGAGQKASLSALINEGMTAVTIRVNDIVGVAGFVTPGDRVDVLLTRHEKKSDTKDEKSFTDIILQDVRVLGVDQLADDRQEKPSVAKAVTVETRPEDAQRVVLATTVGHLSLVLRKAGAVGARLSKRITTDDLGLANQGLALSRVETSSAQKETVASFGVVHVTRSLKTTDYQVRMEPRISAGGTMAAKPGKAMRSKLERSSSRNSRLISRPTRKKKIAVNQSEFALTKLKWGYIVSNN